MAAIQELAQDERSPTLREDLGAARDGAELTVLRHGDSQRLGSADRKFIFWAFTGRAPPRSFPSGQ
jgi:hypothetical protein